MKNVYFFSLFYWAIYIGIAILASLILLVSILYPLDISIASDVVFGILAMVSFLISEMLFRRAFKWKMLISKRLPYSTLYPIGLLCLYIVFFGL